MIATKGVPKLVVLPSLRMVPFADGKIGLTRKFLDGAEEYLRYWRGTLTVLAEIDFTVGSNLDNISVDPSRLPFLLKLVDYDKLEVEVAVSDATVVLASAGHRQNHVARVCKRLGVPCAYVTEYSLRTRLQIVEAETPAWHRRLRRQWWERTQERHQRAAIALAQGVQCNGTPTYDAYRGGNANPMLFFDTRVTAQMMITRDELESRLAYWSSGLPIRLLFSGRLIAMKGADDLILVARHLKAFGVAFEFVICGDGDLADDMRSRIPEFDLHRHVKIVGVLDFHTQLVPRLKHQTDLFVCCHRQGDPSCTYLETMSCGVPIVGYDNEAFAGVVAASTAGWALPMNDPLALARKVQELERSRRLVAEQSRRSLAFASRHTFESTFERRVNHLQALRS